MNEINEKQIIDQRIKFYFDYIKNKMNKSLALYLTLNILLILLTASSSILNLYMVRFNKANFEVKLFFIFASIFSIISSSISSIMSLFVFKKMSNNLLTKENKLLEEIYFYENKMENYADENKDKELLKRVSEILLKN